MGVIPERIEYKNFPKELFVRFAEELSKRRICEKVAFTASNDKSHFDRYGFVRDNKKISVVYDNKAKMMSVTAGDDIIPVLSGLVDALKENFLSNAKQSNEPTEKTDTADRFNEFSKKKDVSKRSSKKKANKKSDFTDSSDSSNSAKTTDKALSPDIKVKSSDTDKSKFNSLVTEKSAEYKNKADYRPKDEKFRNGNGGAQSDKKVFSADKSEKKSSLPQKEKKSVSVKEEALRIKTDGSMLQGVRVQSSVGTIIPSGKDKAVPSKNMPAESSDSDACGDISLKKYTVKRFGGVIDKIKADKKKYKLLDEEVTDKGKATELDSYTVSGGGQKLKLRFMPKKGVVQLQGKRGTLFSELQLLLSEQTDYKAAVDAHIEQSREDKKAGQVERQLKKLIPDAFPFLSEQSKIDFTIGVIEIINSSDKHYDYSMLLLPPFRGLEKLIFDLQRAQGITVKMIGQAYEKEEGNYVLKASYRRKINSIVYAEVMADLYREYFETRNYYAHSDSSEKNELRIINKKEQAVSIFQNMLKKVEYNCKKLSEIGFSI